jgi:hypothetical protein
MNTTKEARPGPAGQIKRDQRRPIPQGAGNRNNNGAAVARRTFVEDLQRRQTYPFRGSDQDQDAIAKCMEARQAQRQSSKLALSTPELEPYVVAKMIALLILIGVTIWLGSRVLGALP